MDWQYSVGLQERNQAYRQPPETIVPMVVDRRWGYSGWLRCILANSIHGSPVGYSFDRNNTLCRRVRKTSSESFRIDHHHRRKSQQNRFEKGPQRLD
jgi:hypothetical protein